MTTDVTTVSASDSVGAVVERIVESEGHAGFPVVEDDRVVGFVSARDLLAVNEDTPIAATMSGDPLVAQPEMDIDDAARVILRAGIQKLPVVDDEDRLVGIISNTDVVRSQIERATPEKVGQIRRTLESIHGFAAAEERHEVAIADLVPTQTEVYADELAGRRYELERGLAEPLVVINEGELLLADGHHRALAARRLDIERIEAYVIVVDEAVDLGLAETELDGVGDLEVVDYARHPLVETTERLR
jgi:IMP dehydrogenase